MAMFLTQFLSTEEAGWAEGRKRFRTANLHARHSLSMTHVSEARLQQRNEGQPEEDDSLAQEGWERQGLPPQHAIIGRRHFRGV